MEKQLQVWAHQRTSSNEYTALERTVGDQIHSANQIVNSDSVVLQTHELISPYVNTPPLSSSQIKKRPDTCSKDKYTLHTDSL